MVGLNGLEPSTSRLSGARSNQLSYRPRINHNYYTKDNDKQSLSKLNRTNGRIQYKINLVFGI